MNGPLLYVINSCACCKKRESVLEREAESYNSMSSANIWCCTECRSIISDRVCVYRTEITGPSTEPRGTPYNKEDGSDSRCRTETTCLRLRYDSKHARAVVSAMNIKNISQTVQQYVMTYCIECCTQIEKSRDQSVVRITTGQRIIKDMKQGCLCTVL